MFVIRNVWILGNSVLWVSMDKCGQYFRFVMSGGWERYYNLKTRLMQFVVSWSCQYQGLLLFFRNSCPEVFLGKGLLKICSKFTGEHLSRSAISIKLCNFIEITLRHRFSPVNLLYIFRTPSPKNISWCLFLIFEGFQGCMESCVGWIEWED